MKASELSPGLSRGHPDEWPMLSGALYNTMNLDQLISQMSEYQQRLFACDCAERVLSVYEAQHPADVYPRLAVETARRYANGAASIRDVDRALHAMYELKQPNEFLAASSALDDINLPLTADDDHPNLAWKAAVRAVLAAWFPEIRTRSTTMASERASTGGTTIEQAWQRERAIWYLTFGHSHSFGPA